MLEVRDLAVNYGAVSALRGVSLEIEKGEIVAVIGANGAGKSTLLWSISGIVRPRSGTVQFEGKRIDGQRPEAIARAGISLVPEGRHIFGSMTVRENLEIARLRGQDGQRADLQTVLERFPFLDDRLHAQAGKLSGGEQQQLAIARALLARPALMLLDEPSLGLAPRLVELVMSELASLREAGITILLVEQAAAVAVELADRSYVFRNGLIELSGARDDLLNNADFAGAYLGADLGEDS